MFQHLDANTNAFLILNTSSRWLGIALVIINSISLATSLFVGIFYLKHLLPIRSLNGTNEKDTGEEKKGNREIPLPLISDP